MLDQKITAKRLDALGSVARCRNEEIILDRDVNGRADAFNPVELLLAAVSACMIKGIERVRPMLAFDLRGAGIRLHAVGQDAPPKIISIDYEFIVDADEPDRPPELMHTNVRKFGTISNTLAAAARLNGGILRATQAHREAS